jgi:sulfide dehydrogenase cytochrome subunit
MKTRAIPAIARFVATIAATIAAAIATAQQPPPPAPAFAAPNLTEKGVRSLASACAICHGTEGRPAEGSVLPALAGRNEREIVEAMTAFKEGKRQATVMHQIAKGYSDAEIAAVAAYFARQPR